MGKITGFLKAGALRQVKEKCRLIKDQFKFMDLERKGPYSPYSYSKNEKQGQSHISS